jgi:hypothetical protein
MVLTTFLCKLAVSQSFPSHLPDRWRGCSLGPALRGAGHGCNRCFFFLTNHEIKKPLAKETSSFLKNRNVLKYIHIYIHITSIYICTLNHGIFHISIGVFWEATGCWNYGLSDFFRFSSDDDFAQSVIPREPLVVSVELLVPTYPKKIYSNYIILYYNWTIPYDIISTSNLQVLLTQFCNIVIL